MKTVAQQIVRLLIRKTNEHTLIWQPAGEYSYAAGYLIWIYRLEWAYADAATLDKPNRTNRTYETYRSHRTDRTQATLIAKNHSFSGLREYAIPDRRIQLLRLRQAIFRQQLRLKGGEYSRAEGGFLLIPYAPDDRCGALASALLGLGGEVGPIGREARDGHR